MIQNDSGLTMRNVTRQSLDLSARGARMIEGVASGIAEAAGIGLDVAAWNFGKPVLAHGPNELLLRAGPHRVLEYFPATEIEQAGRGGLASETFKRIRAMVAELQLLERTEKETADLRISNVAFSTAGRHFTRARFNSRPIELAGSFLQDIGHSVSL